MPKKTPLSSALSFNSATVLLAMGSLKFRREILSEQAVHFCIGSKAVPPKNNLWVCDSPSSRPFTKGAVLIQALNLTFGLGIARAYVATLPIASRTFDTVIFIPMAERLDVRALESLIPDLRKCRHVGVTYVLGYPALTRVPQEILALSRHRFLESAHR